MNETIFPETETTTTAEYSVRKKVDEYGSNLRKKHLNFLFIQKRKIEESIYKNLQQTAFKDIDDLKSSLLFWTETFEKTYKNPEMADIAYTSKHLSSMINLLHGFDDSTKEAIIEFLVDESKLVAFTNLLNLPNPEFIEIIDNVLYFLINAFMVSNRVIQKIYDSGLGNKLFFLFENGNLKTASMALLCLVNLLTDNIQMRNELESQKVLPVIFPLFVKDMSNINENASKENIEIADHYFQFFGAYFNMPPFFNPEITEPYLTPCFVAICNFSHKLTNSLFYIIDFLNAVCTNLNEDIFMNKLDAFGPIFGKQLVHFLDSIDDELVEVVIKLIANLSSFDNQNVYIIFNNTLLVKKIESLLKCPSKVNPGFILKCVLNFVHKPTEEICEAFIQNHSIFEIIADNYLENNKTEIDALMCLNHFLRHYQHPIILKFAFDRCDLFKKIYSRLHVSRDSELIWLILQIFGNYLKIGDLLKDNGMSQQNSFFENALEDQLLMENFKMLLFYHNDVETREYVGEFLDVELSLNLIE